MGNKKDKKGYTYKSAGVDIDAGNKAVNLIKRLAKSTFTKDVLTDIGGFSGLYNLNLKKYKNPVLVSSTDSVGTKLKIAQLLNKHHTIGIDLVAMCIDDIVCCGAKPLFLLDCFSCGKLFPEKLAEVMKGIVKGCREGGVSLIGGEIAELPGFYKKDEYDLVGFGVGIVNREKIIDGSKIEIGNKIIGLSSSGLHSNGYSLARKVFLEVGKYKLDYFSPDLNKTVGEELLVPTKIYAKIIVNLLEKFEIKGIAHITGGGLVENIPRILPKGSKAIIKKGSWEVLPVFKLIQEIGKIKEEEMFRVFNMGIGMVLIVKSNEAEKILNHFKKVKQKASIIGEIVKGERGVEFYD